MAENENENWGMTKAEFSEAMQEVADRQQAAVIARVDASHAKDFDGSRRRYADSVSTSEALRKRVASHKALFNGHGGIS